MRRTEWNLELKAVWQWLRRLARELARLLPLGWPKKAVGYPFAAGARRTWMPLGKTYRLMSGRRISSRWLQMSQTPGTLKTGTSIPWTDMEQSIFWLPTQAVRLPRDLWI